MIYEIEVINGHHVVDMRPDTLDKTDKPIEIFIEVLKCMTGVKLIELGAEGMGDLRKWSDERLGVKE